MATQYDSGFGTFEADAAISANRLVKINADGEIAAATTANNDIHGVTQEDANAAGDYVTIKFFAGPGTHRVSVTGCPVTCGDTVYSALSGQVCRTGGTVTVGVALESANSNGAIIQILPLNR